MASYAIHSCHPVTFAVSDYFWLPAERLSLPTHLTEKLAVKLVVPYKITQYINPMAYHLVILYTWWIHGMFHTAFGFVPGAVFDTPFRPSADSSDKLKVEDILDNHVMHIGTKYLIK